MTPRPPLQQMSMPMPIPVGHTPLRYLVAGGVAAASNYAARFVFSRWLPFEAAVAAAAVVGTVVAFVLMRRYVFGPGRQPLHRQGTAFLMVSVASAAQTLLVSSLLARWLLPALGLERGVEAVAHAVGMAVPALTSYFAHRWISFR